MIALLQRVTRADVTVDCRRVAEIGPGLLVFACAVAGDSDARVCRMAERIVGYRLFPDGSGKMNLSLRDVAGELLLVPQFTLAADTSKGMRPSFTPSAPPEQGRALFDLLVTHARSLHPTVATGVFGDDMRVSLTNDGPVTIWLET
jgi:D-tyrosyl-tRNA(Tyr) deacylase